MENEALYDIPGLDKPRCIPSVLATSSPNVIILAIKESFSFPFRFQFIFSFAHGTSETGVEVPYEVPGCLPFDRKFRKFRMEGKW